MRTIIFLFCTLIIIPQIKADTTIDNRNFVEPKSTTAEEGYLRGLGSAIRGIGNAMRDLGEYQKFQEEARRMSIDNYDHAVRKWWAIQDSYKDRNQRENALERRARLMDMAELKHTLDQREKELRDKGVMRDSKPSDYIPTPEAIAERTRRRWQRTLDEVRKEIEHQDAVNFLAQWEKMSPVARDTYLREKRLEKLFPIDDNLSNLPQVPSQSE